MDASLTNGFAAFFEAVWDKRPFAWQTALAERVLTNDASPWPQSIALPTAAGKTACIDIAVFALAAQAAGLGAEQPLTAPRRIFFVVDRRVIVDEAFDRARKLAAALRSPKTPIVAQVAESLRALASGPGGSNQAPSPLEVFELRGGMYRSEAWARSPLQPLVVASTVDQLGSRLLFRAYGRGSGMWPVYAGLTGNDSLILLDEAHCARPFLQTLRAVAKYRTWAEAQLRTPFYPVVLSATPPGKAADDTFRDTSEQPRDPEHPLGRRQLARKPTRLIQSSASGKTAFKRLAKELAAQALELATGPRKAIVVFVNRVATARETHRLLQDFCKKHGGEAILLTGRMRPLDRDRVLGEKLRVLTSAAAPERSFTKPVFVVATQTLEVGADLDFDALVSECASLDALRQRFGRLNRMGRELAGRDASGCPLGAEAVILVREDQAKSDAEDPVYGAAIAKTWSTLESLAGEAGVLDFGIAHLDAEALMGNEGEGLNAPAPDAPVLLPSHLDAWVQTSPEPTPVPEVALFLHGTDRGTADVRVCWRADLSLDSESAQRQARDALILCPPSVAESLPVPIGVMRHWLDGEDDDDSSDIEGANPDLAAGSGQSRPMGRRALRWLGRREPEPAEIMKQGATLRPGDVLVIPSALDGRKMLGQVPDEDAEHVSLDLGDQAHLRARAKALLRLHPALVRAWPDEYTAKAAMMQLLEQPEEEMEEDPDGFLDDLVSVLSALAEQEPASGWQWLQDAAAHFTKLKRRELRRALLRHPDRGVVLNGRRLLPAYMGEAERFTDEDDAIASSTRAVPLLPEPEELEAEPKAHLAGVAVYARRFAAGCQLPAALVEAIERAGLLHDLGKADPRFQALLHNGNPWIKGVLLAKSGELPQSGQAFEQARLASGYPKGSRHELLSVRLAESAEGALLPAPDDPLRSLILHLIASHHGHCRPFAPVVPDPDPPIIEVELLGHRLTYDGPTGLERLESGVAERFWLQTRRYGWWGSAWLEAILRLADHRRSETEALT
ncbi:type I-G CRISPR-associated helicase/endonuclease Cas3g [Thiorhodococcus minor]|uniref:Type I-U CRISPR-associated helicase/endonuclease Cas3 n=1 Tax=Thiorhodococcus minor TaxID=57489 RepID=A0A6M0JX01_9GAMM|nr:type I-U CRISPR-associated helicase/endonuclease Cas3 [Thiorhodococcus minor]NEV60665.1 type I-U CRISPR-associated helicase/endonuclease Cas3 [Thiorhodococcus minor]